MVWAVAALWLASLIAVWLLAGRQAVGPQRATSQQQTQQLEKELRQAKARLREFDQRDATLRRSDQISRQANLDLQGTLAQRDEEIASLRADVAFYERLVGPTSPRQGLNVFNAEFVPLGENTWKYQIVLTQNLNRGSVSSGRMRFSVEGIRDGKLATMDWAQLHQKPDIEQQPYSFRYFQQLEGNVTLPPGFTPQRVRVWLRGDNVTVQRDFDWTLAEATP
ncbi:hypothetical protein CSC70_03690 [Pseudoxanthomonas kalamensis DSM 18571]|nr:hypothetical protein CSC70_03690 [Pseudoxanthomonas kalamensis DSM 18571]